MAELRRARGAHPSVRQRRARQLRGIVFSSKSMRGIADPRFSEVHMDRETAVWKHGGRVRRPG